VGLVWEPWHVPFLLAGLNYPRVNFWVALLVFCFMVVVLSFAYTWFCAVSRGSVLVVALLHQSNNTLADNFWQPPLMSEGSQPAATTVGGVVMLVMIVVVCSLFKRPVRVGDPHRFVHTK
jgi:uncharacterized protein